MPGTHFIRKCCICKRPSPIKECIIHSNPQSIPRRLEAFGLSQSLGVLTERALVKEFTNRVGTLGQESHQLLASFGLYEFIW